MHACRLGGLLHLSGRNGAGGARLGRQHPDESCTVEVGLSVHEEIGEVVDVAVVVTPPHDGRVGHILIVLVHQSGSGLRLNGLPLGLVDVVVVAELLNDETGGEAESPTRCTRHVFTPSFWAQPVYRSPVAGR